MGFIKKQMREKIIVIIPFLVFAALLIADTPIAYNDCLFAKSSHAKKNYGVFLGMDASKLDKLTEYRTVVIDAQYFSKKDISYLRKEGCKVYSYLNIGSLENFRAYYDKYSYLAMGEYVNWEEEQWVDVSSKDWQKFLISLEKKLINKGVDGFFVDNCDVYYEYPKKSIFKGLTTILKHLMTYDKTVIINGGDAYVMKYLKHYGSLQAIMTGVNQESVFSKIDFDKGTFRTRVKSERKYYQKYLEACSKEGLDVYLLEYTKNSTLKRKVKMYCQEKHFQYYISGSIELM